MNKISDLAAERAVLSGILNFGNECYIDISDIISAGTFTLDSNQIIWKIVNSIFEKDNEAIIDLPTFLSTASSLGWGDFFEKTEERNHLRAIYNFPVEKQSVRKLSAKIRKLEIGRLAQKQLQNINLSLENLTGEETVANILGLIENPLFNFTSLLYKNDENDPKLIFENVQEYIQYIIKNPIDQIGVVTGFPYWDMSIGGGLRNATVNIIGARLKIGKSSLAINIAHNILNQNITILYLDTEMTEKDITNRFLAESSETPIKEIETGKIKNINKILETGGKIEKLPYHYLNISGQPFEETLSLMRRWIYKKVGFKNGKANRCVIIYDYLKLLSSDPMKSTNLQEFQLLGFMMTSLHNFAVHYDVPILTFTQLNRDGISREETDIVAGSERIGWLYFNLTILKPQSDEEIASQHGNKIIYNRKLIPIACRHGPGLEDGDYINVKFDGNICKVIEGPTRFIAQKNKSIISNNRSEE